MVAELTQRIWHYFTQEEYLREDRFPQLGGDVENEAGSVYIRLKLARTDVALANGDNDDVATATGYIRVTGPTAAFAVTGFAGGSDGRALRLYSTVSQTMTIKNEDLGSVAANRILTLTGADVVLRTNGPAFASFVYDGVGERWILMSTN